VITTTVLRAGPGTSTDPADVSGRTYDLAVIGAGPVGVSAALLAASKRRGNRVLLVDAPRASGALMNEDTGEDLSLGGPTGLFSKALRASVKRISVASLKGMGLRDDRFVFFCFFSVFFVPSRGGGGGGGGGGGER